MAKLSLVSYQLDLRSYELRRSDGVKVKLERQPMELLILLSENKGQLVTREQVAAKLWPGVSVDTEPAINNAIRKIRTALHDSPERPAHIETVVGKGYRFIGDLDVVGATDSPMASPLPAPVEDVPPPKAAVKNRRNLTMVLAFAVAVAGIAGWALWRSSRTQSNGPIRSLAVLPLQNLSGDPAQDYFAEGITDELTTNLAKIGSLRVISRTSTMQYKAHGTPMSQIVKDLNVDAVIEGSVVRAGNKVRITAQLIDARNDSHLWAQSYERDLGDILDLQRTVALEIASRVKAKVSPEDRRAWPARQTVNPEAYEAYLRGRNEMEKQGGAASRAAARFFQRAIDLDPLYAAAYAGLAESVSNMSTSAVVAPMDAFPRAEAAARRALELDNSLGEAHAALGIAKHHFHWDWSGAEAEYQRAIQLSPGLAFAHTRYAVFLSDSGRHEEAMREIAKSRDLDPLSLIIRGDLCKIMVDARRYDAAIPELQKILTLNPNLVHTRNRLGIAYAAKRMYPEAIAEFKQVMAVLGNNRGVDLALVYALAGQSDAAKHLLQNGIEQPNEAGVLDWMFIATVYEALGDRDAAIRWLEEACENRDFFLTRLKVYPFLDSMRSDPRFVRILERVGVPKVP